ncbi:unnamed protein product [Spirodela intermedia]|uniref:ZF-HD dimerization-type domain-containing protein n=1 Tax=Spirodela intermedia TaxID=51605 RepID=A0A7I8IS94_SPIIN|nr:unnamed protein product [Spirodela intermedia]CAA6660438.1 unnamed protein product [Spirodela intermedia]
MAEKNGGRSCGVGAAAAVGVSVRYWECMKNHAAGLGAQAFDGCGEFMPGGEQGTLEALKCAACGCHRNFHRKEEVGAPLTTSPTTTSTRFITQFCSIMPLRTPPPRYPPSSATLFRRCSPSLDTPTAHWDYLRRWSGMQPPQPFSYSAPATDMSFGRERDRTRKRFRTKFTPEQKEEMQKFAEKVGWRIQRHDNDELQEFCSKVGVKRQVLKVWMHNNKSALSGGGGGGGGSDGPSKTDPSPAIPV